MDGIHLTLQSNPTCSIADSPIPSNYTMSSASTDTIGLPHIATAFAPLLSNGYVQNSINFLFFGTILETIRQLWQWIVNRFTSSFVLTAIFDSNDPAYEWFFTYLNDQKIWSDTREVHVSAKTNSRTWGFKSNSDDGDDDSCAQYLPVCEQPQLFRFKSTWCQVVRTKSSSTHAYEHELGGQLILTLYTRKREVLDDLIQTSREMHLQKNKKGRLVVHGSCPCGSFCTVTTKSRRGLDSLILPEGVKETLVNDAQDFLRSEAWYAEAGIQHKRGYLLYGPPGTGKSSTVHALAGELDLEIYTLSLATNGLDDGGLSRLVASTPAHSIILIEDIDCAFPSREEKERKKEAAEKGLLIAEAGSTITLSGLLNVIDGCSSEEGRLLFATTNYVDRLDPALLRAGRMDVKICYRLSTRDQIVNLFKRFYPCAPGSKEVATGATICAVTESETTEEKDQAQGSDPVSDLDLTPPLTPVLSPTPTPTPPRKAAAELGSPTPEEAVLDDDATTPLHPPRLPWAEVDALATRFADAIPPNTFTVAELQGYLLTLKMQPYEAVEGVHKWMEEMAEERERLKMREVEDAKEKEEMQKKGMGMPLPLPMPMPMLPPMPLPPPPPFRSMTLPPPPVFFPPSPPMRGFPLRGRGRGRGRGGW
ncbi:hypothetical protein FRB94_003613 [Tulasnella sp. JGI-2019a]|nr:hypothetical protein FRB94_003613 [Tulasnella sp. JGI-2019a]KAG9008916.1 hypothetical protein FRB93_005966 [Tulasnella sp. JGI-2019a]